MKKMYKVIIVDDEIKGRELIKALLAKYTEFTIISECSSAKEAQKEMLKEMPDLLFLDIQMPENNGFDLAYQLEYLGIKTPIIFVTAYEKYMLKAFKIQPFGYLLKPVNPQDFSEVLFRFKKQYPSKIHTSCANYILFTTPHGVLQICIEDICYIAIIQKIAKVHLREGKTLKSTTSLQKLEQILPTNTFFRISKSVIINLNCLYRISPAREVILTTHTTPLKVGKEYFTRLKKRFTII